MKRRIFAIALLTFLITSVWASGLGAQSSFPVRVDRWLEVRRLSGQVFLLQGNQQQTARIGQRLQSIGDGVRTRSNSEVTLAIDSTVGFVQVSENTDLQITELRGTARGGRVTELTVNRGQARVQTRPFTNPDTRLDLRTPAGISGVRGTVFGVTIQPNGRTGVATEEGTVVSEAQGVAVDVNAGFQTLIVPGEAPQQPMPLRDDPSLDLQVLREIDEAKVEIEGQIDPVNLLIFDGETQQVEESGAFRLVFDLPDNRRILLSVRTPLGTEQVYELVSP
ncbi:MAG: FecR domain-containing protein [Cyanobacteria bacterium P01_A01_bin.123]